MKNKRLQAYIRRLRRLRIVLPFVIRWSEVIRKERVLGTNSYPDTTIVLFPWFVRERFTTEICSELLRQESTDALEVRGVLPYFLVEKYPEFTIPHILHTRDIYQEERILERIGFLPDKDEFEHTLRVSHSAIIQYPELPISKSARSQLGSMNYEFMTVIDSHRRFGF